MDWQWSHVELSRPACLGALAAAAPLLALFSWRGLLAVSRARHAVLFLCRAAVIALSAAALAGPAAVWSTSQPTVFVAVDRSASVSDEGRGQAERFVQDATAHARGRGRVVLGPARPEDAGPGGLAGPPPDSGLGTDLQAEIEAAGAHFGADAVPRLVLLSDGLQTRGDAAAAARAAGFPVFTVPLASNSNPEAYVADVRVRSRVVRPAEPFDVEVVVSADREGRGTIELLQNGKSVLKEPAEVKRGENRFTFRRTVGAVPAAEFTARIEGFPDTIGPNNQASCLVFPGEKRRVLLVEGRSGAFGRLAAALGAGLMEVETRAPGALPRARAGFDPYDLVLLANVPAAALAPESMAGLRDYVRSGGGLVVVGGDQSLTPGAYRGTVLEEILPVECEARRKRRRPGLAMAVVIDRSASMEGDPISLAREATRRAVELLDPQDQVGVMAFDETPEWISPLGPCADRGPVLERIARIEAGGRTDALAALDRAHLALDEAFADLKHVVLLTDGISQPGDFDGLARRMAASGMTLSTVAVGKEAAGPLLEELARIGRGRYYFCPDPAAVPRVFAIETASAGKVGVYEEPFFARPDKAPAAQWPIDLESAPALLGHVETQARPQSKVLLATASGDPLLAAWRDGRGAAIVFTSDAEDRWAAAWLGWPGFGTFWTRVARAALRSDDCPPFDLRADARDARVRVTLDAPDGEGGFYCGGEFAVEVSGPGRAPRRAAGRQTAPGRYVAEFDFDAPGCRADAWLRWDGREFYAGRPGVSQPPDDEWRTRPPDESLLREIARVSGGTFQPRLEEVFAPSPTPVTRAVALWPHLLGAAAVLFVLDVALRRAAARRAARVRC